MSLTTNTTLKVNGVQHMMTSTPSVSFSNVFPPEYKARRPSQRQRHNKMKKKAAKRSTSFTFSHSISQLSIIERALGRTGRGKTRKSRDCQEPPTSSSRSEQTKRLKVFHKHSIKGTMAKLAGLRADVGSFVAPNAFRDRDAKNKKKVNSSESLRTVSTIDSLDGSDSNTLLTVIGRESMYHGLPITSETTEVFFRKGQETKDVIIETIGGVLVGSIEFSRFATASGIRFLKDSNGKLCAIIQKKMDNSLLREHNIPTTFLVYGDKPCYFGQTPRVYGCYLWGGIQIMDSMGAASKFVMKRPSLEASSCSADQHTAEPFGSFLSKATGYKFFNNGEKECAKMVSLNKNRDKGIVIAPNCDMGLMLAFCSVVDEMVENNVC